MTAYDFEGNDWDDITESEKRNIVDRLVRERDALSDDYETLVAEHDLCSPDTGAEERLRAALEHEHGPECGECITLARSTVMAFAVEAGLEHVDRFDCWCGPVKDYEDPATGNQVWVHREVSS